MGTISSGIGLVSGMDIGNIVKQLMAIESRPRDALKTRVDDITKQKTALMEVQAKVMALQVSAASFNKEQVFEQKSVVSSNEDILTATGTKYAPNGNYSFTPLRLATANHLVSGSYSSFDSFIGAGTISFEMGQGQLSRPTKLDSLNGQQGVQRGKFNITDKAGHSADIDISMALTLQDVIDTINQNNTIDVKASVSGDHLVITDTSSGSGNLIVADLGSGSTAADLGIRGNVSGNKITGQNIISINKDTLLSTLNDNNGVRDINSAMADMRFHLADGSSIDVDLKDKLSETIGDDTQSTLLKALNSGGGIRSGTFRITDQNGHFVDIDMSNLSPDATLGQLKTYIQNQAQNAGMDISIAFGGLDHITVKDNSTDPSGGERQSHFTIKDLDGGHAAEDLGIAGDVKGGTITGQKIWHMDTVGDVINAINNDWNNTGGKLTASVNSAGTGLMVTDNTTGSGTFSLEALNGSNVADDLGLTVAANGNSIDGRRLIAGLNTVMLRSLNGGSGGDPLSANYGANRIENGGTIDITDRSGNSVSLDLSGANTVQDVLDAINNQSGVGVTAAINKVGNGIVLTDNSGGSGNLVVSGDLADKLHLTVDDAVNSIDSGNLQVQYVSESAKLSDLRQGRGISRGKFTITDGEGNSATINLAQDRIKTLSDVIDEINGRTNIHAFINDTGDGIELVDTSTGSNVSAFSVQEDGSDTTAADLGIVGTASKKNSDGQYYIDGSYEFKLNIGPADTLGDVIDKVNDANVGIKASVIQDGSGYRLSFNSEIKGSKGNIYIDPGDTSLKTSNISRGQDAVVMLGFGSDDHPLLISSDSNTIKNAVKGVTLELHSTSSQPVNITISQDLEGITTQMGNFVKAYNDVMDELDKVDNFNPDTLKRSVLFADTSVRSIRNKLQLMVQRTIKGMPSSYNRLSDIGITFAPLSNTLSKDSNGKDVSYAVAGTPKLMFDESKFKAAFAANPDAVTNLFTEKKTGIGDYISDQLNDLASTTTNSIIKARLDTMDNQQKLFKDRIDYLDKILSDKEKSLYTQFYNMESALASLQSQQSALNSLTGISAPSTTAKK